MENARNCRSQSVECLQLSRFAPNPAEAKILKDIAYSWMRLANQIERYNELAKSNRTIASREDPRPPNSSI